MSNINTITINGQSVSFKYGLTITDILSKELNTGVLVIPQTDKLDIEPLDEVVITFEIIKVIRMVIAQINTKIVNHEGSKKYNYTIGLASTTLKLQRIVLPSRTITNTLDGSVNKSIFTVLNEYRSIYAPTFTLSSTLQSKTASVTCPEFSWNRPTLFEVFNDILGVIGCVVTVIGTNTISLLDLYDKQDLIDETKLANFETNWNVAEYSNAIEIQASNVYDTNVNKTSEFLTVRTTEQAFLTTNNQEIVLQKPIFQIKKITAKILITTGFQSIVQDIDITNRVVEQRVYDTFYNTNAAGFVADTPSKKYRRNYLVYKQGGNTISGIGYRENTWIPYVNGRAALVTVLYWTMQDTNNPYKNNFNAAEYDAMVDNKVLFFVEYLSADDITFRVIKDKPTRNPSVLINNQTNAEVYAKSLGKQQQEFVNRIGNEEMIITGRYATYDEIPKPNDFIDEFILVSREISFEQSYYLFKGTMSKNYAKDNMFAGINTSKRYTEIASPSQALISNHISHNILELSTVSGSSSIYHNNHLQFGKANEKIQGAVVRTITNQATSFPFAHTQSFIFGMQGTSHILGNSIIYNIRMEDNTSVGLSIESDFRLLAANVQSMRKNSYVNDLGRFYAIAIRFYKQGGIRNLALNNTNFNNPDDTFGIVNFEKGTEVAAKLPIISNTETFNLPSGIQTYTRIDDTKLAYQFLDTGPFSVGGLLDYKVRHKDNREITSETIQFSFRKKPNAFFTEKFLEYNPYIFDETSDLQLFAAYSTTETYNDNDTDYKGTLNFTGSNQFIQIVISANQIYLSPTSFGQNFWNSNATTMVSWAICDVNGKIIVARNGNLTQRLFLNSVSIV